MLGGLKVGVLECWDGDTTPITWMNVKTKGIENGQFVS